MFDLRSVGWVVRCAYAQPEKVVDAERAKRSAEDAGQQSQPSFLLMSRG